MNIMSGKVRMPVYSTHHPGDAGEMPRRSCPVPQKSAAYGVVETRKFSASHHDGRRLTVSEGDMESVASLFGRIIALRCGDKGAPGSEEVDQGVSLDAHVRAAMRAMKERLASITDGPLQDAEVIVAKHNLYSICWEEIVSVAGAVSPGLSGAIRNLRDSYDGLLREVPEVVRRTLDGYKQEVFALHADKEREAKEAKELVQAAQALERETIALHEESVRMHARVSELQEENASLKKRQHEGEHLSPVPRLLATPRETVINESTSATSTRMSRPKGLAAAGASTNLGEASNGVGLEGEAASGASPETLWFTWTQGEGGVAAEHKAWAGTAATPTTAVTVDGGRELSLKQLHGLIASVYASKEKYDRHCIAQGLPSQTMSRHLDDFLVHRYGLTTMAKTQAAALWNGVKKFRDSDNAVKVFDMTLRNEVDESFRQQQLDLENAVLDIIRARIRERTARHDNSAKHDDRYSYRRLGGTSISRVAAANPGSSGNRLQGGGGAGSTRGAYCLADAGASAASHATIEAILRRQTRPSTPIAAADWQAVVHHVCKGANTADAQTVGFLVKEAVSKARQGPKDPDNSGSGAKDRGCGDAGGRQNCSVPFGLFLQVLLEYQLHGYLRRLKTFRKDFREVDVDADGVLNPAQFLALAKRTLGRAQKTTGQENNSRRISPGYSGRDHKVIAASKGRISLTQQTAARLRSADPKGFGAITFSQCVLNLADVC